tara:strand:+ start:57 stop:416 length:360 start_codon:yes stop_codon:yes gene_type:complete
MPVSTINYKNKRIVFIDYTDCKTKEEMIATLREAAELFKASPEKVLSLSDFTDAFGSKEFMDESKRLSVEVLRAKTEKAALLGITGIKKVLLKGFNAFSTNKLVPFDTKEEALEYLVSE